MGKQSDPWSGSAQMGQPGKFEGQRGRRGGPHWEGVGLPAEEKFMRTANRQSRSTMVPAWAVSSKTSMCRAVCSGSWAGDVDRMEEGMAKATVSVQLIPLSKGWFSNMASSAWSAQKRHVKGGGHCNSLSSTKLMTHSPVQP